MRRRNEQRCEETPAGATRVGGARLHPRIELKCAAHRNTRRSRRSRTRQPRRRCGCGLVCVLSRSSFSAAAFTFLSTATYRTRRSQASVGSRHRNSAMIAAHVLESTPLPSGRPKLAEAICRLPTMDPFDQSIAAYVKPAENDWKHNCKPKFTRRSWLDANGVLTFNQTEAQAANERCDYRCLMPAAWGKLKYGSWTTLAAPLAANATNTNVTRPGCDTIETRCTANKTETYNFLHQQIVEQK